MYTSYVLFICKVEDTRLLLSFIKQYFCSSSSIKSNTAIFVFNVNV